MAGHISRMAGGGVNRGVWCGNLRERDNLKDFGRRWKDNVKMDLQEVGWGHGLD